jgi:hypothetical protein
MDGFTFQAGSPFQNGGDNGPAILAMLVEQDPDLQAFATTQVSNDGTFNPLSGEIFRNVRVGDCDALAAKSRESILADRCVGGD